MKERSSAPGLMWVYPTLLTGCATQPAPGAGPGFLMGLLHGLIAPASLVGSFFWDIRIYAFPNAGLGYDFGFMLGLGMLVLLVVLPLILVMPKVGGYITREDRD